jgi:drug/metabolite transporter (DMT)-like permease
VQNNTTKDTSVIKGIAVSLLGYVIFSSHDALVKVLSDYSVFQIIFFAMLFAYVPFSLARIIDGRSISLHPKNPGLVFLRALFMTGSVSFAFLAFSMLPMVQVYVLLFTTPVLISLLAIPLLGEKIHALRGISILLGFIGVIVVLRPSPENLELGHLFGFAAALCNSSAAIISRKIGNVENAAILILSPLLMSIMLTGGTLYFVYTPMSLSDLGLMFLIGVLALLGQLSILTGYRCAPAAVVAPMQYSQILWAILFGWLFFNESVDQIAVIGLVITVFSGVMIVVRESMVSIKQPVLNTRNIRSVASGPMPTSESDDQSD